MATLLTFWPPGPWAVVMCSSTSFAQSMLTSTSSGSGSTATVQVEVWTRPWVFGGGDAFDGVDSGLEGEALPDAFAFEVEDGVADPPDGGVCVHGHLVDGPSSGTGVAGVDL